MAITVETVTETGLDPGLVSQLISQLHNTSGEVVEVVSPIDLRHLADVRTPFSPVTPTAKLQ